MATATLFTFLFVCFCVPSLAQWNTEDTQDTEVQEFANSAVTSINKASNSMFLSKIVQVDEAHYQLVGSAKQYRLKLTLGETNCRKSAKDLSDCEVNKIQSCTVTGPDSTGKPVENFYCGEFQPVSPKEPDRKHGRIVGGQQEVPVTDTVKDAASFAMDKFNAKSDSPFRAVVTKFKKVTSQIVSGVLYRITVEVGYSQCDNDAQHAGYTVEQCPVNAAADSECTFSVWSRSWLKDDEKLILKEEDCKNVVHEFEVLKVEPRSDESNHAQQSGDVLRVIGGDDHDFSFSSFQAFKTKFGRTYETSTEEQRRFNIFRQNMKMAKKLQDTERGTATYGATKFADLTSEEFSRYVGKNWNEISGPTLPQATIPKGEIPTAFDWRDKNAITPVKNQGMCGSCWAFSTTGNIEGVWAVKKKNLISLSEQELVDCDKLDEGCNGGLPSNAYKEIIRLGGLELETNYPYTGEDDQCQFKTADVKVYINGSVNVSKDENEMAQFLVANGPLSIGINAMAMQWYMGGISHPWSFMCSPSSIDHGVVITGYGVEKDEPYWSIKNSWGTNWGEEGYYRVFRGGGVCGLNLMVTSSVIN